MVENDKNCNTRVSANENNIDKVREKSHINDCSCQARQ